MFRRVNIINQVLRSQRIAFASTVPSNAKPIPLVTCKNAKLNLMLGANNQKKKGKKQNEHETASHGWQHYKSKGDHFTIHPVRDIIEANNLNSVDLSELNLNKRLISNINDKHDIYKATKLQAEAITKIKNNSNVLIAAETGCGKTHAYMIPIIDRLIEEKSREAQSERQFNTPLAVILTPGRELAVQIGKVAEDLGEGFDISVKVITGGNTKQKMMNPSFDDVDILVGSIGAVSKLTSTGIYRMRDVKFVVLDEADTLLDDGFNEKLSYFLQRFPFHLNTQLVLASATMPTNCDDIFREIIDTNILQRVVSDDLHKILPYVTQKFLRMSKADRPEHLLRIVKNETQKKRPIIIFSNKSATCDYVSLFLEDNGVECPNLNGDMLMKIREGRFEKFQNGEVNVLSTTDCIGRGLNTVRARHIINFDFPLHVSDYIHRCGRIGRLGSNTNCIISNFISSMREIDLVRKIEMSARTNTELEDVNANIRKIITDKIEKELKAYDKQEMEQLAQSIKT